MFVVEQAEDKTIPEDFIVQATLQEVKLETVKYTNKDGNPDEFDHVVWWWKVVGPEKYAGRKLRGTCFPELTTDPRNKFRQWVEALIGKELGAGQAIDEDDLVGLPADLTVSHRAGSDDRIFEDVDEVMTPADPTRKRDAVSDVPF